MSDNRRTSSYEPRSRNVSGHNGNGPAHSAQQPPRKRKPRMNPLGALLVVLLVLVVGGIIAYMSIAPLYRGTMAEGIMISDINVSGMSSADALAALSTHATQRMQDISVTINHEGRTWNYGASELNAQIDISKIVNDAMAIGNTGDMKQRRQERRDAAAGRYQFNLEMALTTSNLEYYLEQIKKEIDIPAVEPSMQLDCVGVNYSVEGYTYYQPGIDYSSLFKTTPGSDGTEVDIDATLGLIEQDLADDNVANVQLVVIKTYPKSTEQSLRDNAVLLYHSTSQLRGSTDNRNTNIGTALLNFDGMVIAPDQVVSFNETVGERTEARGYLPAHQIGQDGALEDEVGGGICQAATTLFNAAISAGCTIIKRNPHTWPLYQLDYDWGLDAMVNWGTSDMIFQNTTGHYLYIDFYFDYSYGKPKWVDIDIYGAPFEEGVTIEMESVELEKTDKPEMVYQYKTEEEANKITVSDPGWEYDPVLNFYVYELKASRPGYKFQIFRVWKKDGVEFNREELYVTTYEAQQGLTYKRTGEHMTPTATPTT